MICLFDSSCLFGQMISRLGWVEKGLSDAVCEHFHEINVMVSVRISPSSSDSELNTKKFKDRN